MKFWKDKQGNELTFKEFMARWKDGLTRVTGLQQVKIQIKSTWIMVIGLLAGIFIAILGIERLWWLLIILVGGLGNTLMQLLGLWQKKKLLEKFKFQMEEIDDGTEERKRYPPLPKAEVVC